MLGYSNSDTLGSLNGMMAAIGMPTVEEILKTLCLNVYVYDKKPLIITGLRLVALCHQSC